jgi:hypothetical protein
VERNFPVNPPWQNPTVPPSITQPSSRKYKLPEALTKYALTPEAKALIPVKRQEDVTQ